MVATSVYDEGMGEEARSLAAFGLSSFRPAWSRPLVYAVYGPHSSGVTTLIGSLLMDLKAANQLDAAVVLTRNRPHNYMGGILPPKLVEKAVKDGLTFLELLSRLIQLQRCRERAPEGRGVRPYRLALVADDSFTGKEIGRREVRTAIRDAGDANIMVILATSEAKNFQPGVADICTHAFATRTISTDDPKLLKKHVFVMCTVDDMEEKLRACAPHEFLVSSYRDATISTDPRVFLRRYVPSQHVRSAEFAPGPDPWGSPPLLFPGPALEAAEDAKVRAGLAGLAGAGAAHSPESGSEHEDEDEDEDEGEDVDTVGAQEDGRRRVAPAGRLASLRAFDVDPAIHDQLVRAFGGDEC